MNGEMKWKVSVDGVMTVLLFVLMAYSFFRGALHEWLGLLFMAAFICHQIFNKQWWKGIFRGRFTKRRFIETAVIIGLLVAVVGIMWSGYVMSRHAFSFVSSPRGSRLAAQVVHLSAAHWIFLLSSIHLGLNWQRLQGMIRRFIKPSHTRDEIVETVFFAVSAYGIYAFYERRMWEYLFMQTHFMPFGDTGLFLTDCFAMFILFAGIGYRLSKAVFLK